MKILWLLCFFALSLAQDDIEITLKELDHIVISDDAEDLTLVQFTDVDSDDQPTRIANNINHMIYSKLSINGKDYLLSIVDSGDQAFSD